MEMTLAPTIAVQEDSGERRWAAGDAGETTHDNQARQQTTPSRPGFTKPSGELVMFSTDLEPKTTTAAWYRYHHRAQACCVALA
jgi:hypothetical protein